MEFISIGSLVSGISMEAVMRGISLTRNPLLSQLFYRLRLVESYGTGIKKVKKLYEGYKLPEFSTADGGFFVTLYNKNKNSTPKLENKAYKSDYESMILEYAAAHNGVTRVDVETMLGFKKGKAYSVLKRMCEKGELTITSEGKNTKYYLK